MIKVGRETQLLLRIEPAVDPNVPGAVALDRTNVDRAFWEEWLRAWPGVRQQGPARNRWTPLAQPQLDGHAPIGRDAAKERVRLPVVGGPTGRVPLLRLGVGRALMKFGKRIVHERLVRRQRPEKVGIGIKVGLRRRQR